jgi:hypothetical protein
MSVNHRSPTVACALSLFLSPSVSLLPLLAVAMTVLGCPTTTTTFCYPGDEVEGCAGTTWGETAWSEEFPDGDGTCPVGTYLYCPEGAGADTTSRQVMEAACDHAYDHDWDDCSVRYLCGPVEDVDGRCYLVEVVDPVNS